MSIQKVNSHFRLVSTAVIFGFCVQGLPMLGSLPGIGFNENTRASAANGSKQSLASPEDEEEEETETKQPAKPTVSVQEKSDKPSVSVPANDEFDLSKPQFFGDGPFAAIIPGKPQPQKNIIDAIGKTVTTYSYTDGPNGTYELSFFDANGSWPDTGKRFIDDTEKLFDLVEFTAAKKKNAIAADCPIEFNGKKARLYELRYSTKGDSVAVDRNVLFMAGTRLYRVGCSGKPELLDSSPHVAQFMGSFQIVLPGEQPATSVKPFAWQAPTQKRDVDAGYKAIEASLFPHTVPECKYVPSYPYRVQLIRVAGNSPKSQAKELCFLTSASMHDTFTFFANKLKGNYWKFQKADPGSIRAYLAIKDNTKRSQLEDYLPYYEVLVKCQPQGNCTLVSMSWEHDPAGRAHKNLMVQVRRQTEEAIKQLHR